MRAEDASRSDDGVLVLTRTFEAPRETVFDAWVDPYKFGGWYNWGEGTGSIIGHWEAIPGGTYEFQFVTFASLHHVTGTFREVLRPERLVFTRTGDFKDEHDTIVTVSLREIGGRTEMTLRHDGLRSASDRDAVGARWKVYLDNLAYWWR